MQEGDLDSEQFNAFMGNLLEANSKDMYRSKGVVSLAGMLLLLLLVVAGVLVLGVLVGVLVVGAGWCAGG